MADLADIERALVTLIAAALFPAVSYLPGAYQITQAIPGIAGQGGATAKVVRGWPLQDALLTDLAAGRAVVSVFSEPGMTRNVTRWFPGMTGNVPAPVVATITATASGNTVTLGGTVTAGNVVGIQAGSPARAYATVVQPADTLATIAARLAGKIAGATASGGAGQGSGGAAAGSASGGAVITLPTALNLSAAAMAPQTVLTVTRQQEQGIRVSVWAPTPAVRDTLAGAIDGAIAGLKTAAGALTEFFAVTAYESARIVYRATYSNDAPARDRVWRRDLVYNVEYPTTLIEQDPVMLFSGGTETIGTTATTRQLGALPSL